MSTGSAPARAALAGNPSDGYGGAVLAVCIPDFEARAAVAVGGGPQATPGQGALLVDATVARFAREVLGGAPSGPPFDIEWSTTVPMTVGLGGSSAIVIATLRALCAHHGVTLAPEAMAELALSIEVDDLGIAAGLQDRIAQCYGGLTFMEFSGASPRYESLDPAGLAPLLLAWRPAAAESSGIVHGDLRRRFADGDPVVRDGMAALGAVARRARDAVLAGDREELARCADASFDARAAMLALDPRHVEMIEIARAAGAGANYTGSGGAIVCVCRDPAHRDAVADALALVGCESLCFAPG